MLPCLHFAWTHSSQSCTHTKLKRAICPESIHPHHRIYAKKSSFGMGLKHCAYVIDQFKGILQSRLHLHRHSQKSRSNNTKIENHVFMIPKKGKGNWLKRKRKQQKKKTLTHTNWHSFGQKHCLYVDKDIFIFMFTKHGTRCRVCACVCVRQRVPSPEARNWQQNL